MDDRDRLRGTTNCANRFGHLMLTAALTSESINPSLTFGKP